MMARSLPSPPPLWRIVMLVMLTCLVMLAGVSQATERGDTIVGPIRVIDGDSFEVAGVKIRLHAVDAPEADQICKTEQGKDWACGGWVSKVVADRYSGSVATCTGVDTDRYGRTVARCTVLGADVGAWLVGEGMAFAYVKYGSDYVALERSAAAQNRGLHAVRLQSPEEHRRRGAQPPQVAVQAACTIKGNISAKGVRIYHVPGQKYYDKTRIDTRKGERWFCSEADARAAGWRRSRV